MENNTLQPQPTINPNPPAPQDPTPAQPLPRYIPRKLAIIILAIILILFLFGGAFGIYNLGKNSSTPTLTPTPPAVACTMEAKICPDGVTSVGRQGPKCEFAACPTGTSSSIDASGMKEYKSNKVDGLSFSGYTLKFPLEWTEKTENYQGGTVLTLIKGNYSINISQKPVDGATCPTEASDITINPSVGLIRKAMQTKNGNVTFPFCMSKIGLIFYESANPPDYNMIKEMDDILKTVETQ